VSTSCLRDAKPMLPLRPPSRSTAAPQQAEPAKWQSVINSGPAAATSSYARRLLQTEEPYHVATRSKVAAVGSVPLTAPPRSSK